MVRYNTIYAIYTQHIRIFMYILYLYNFILAIKTRLTLLDDNNNNRTCFLSVVAFAGFFLFLPLLLWLLSKVNCCFV